MICSAYCNTCKDKKEMDLVFVPRNFTNIVIDPLKPGRSGYVLMGVATCKECGTELDAKLIRHINDRIITGETEVISYGS